MAKEALLENDIRAGARLVEELDKNRFAVTSAFWMFDPDQAEWKLVLVSPVFDKAGIVQSYTKLSEIISRTNDIQEAISIGDIKVVAENDPLVLVLKKMILTGKGIHAIRMPPNYVKGIYIQDALVYRST